MCESSGAGSPPFVAVKGHLEWRSVSNKETGVRNTDKLARSQYWKTRVP